MTQQRPKGLVADLMVEFDDDFGAAPSPRYNAAPGQRILAVRSAEDKGREAVMLHWGLVPSWTADLKQGQHPINARSETAASKPTFREALRRRRCVVPAEGFYEWKKAARSPQPYFIRLRSGKPMMFAGLWEEWRDPTTSRILETTAIVTTSAAAPLAHLHDRMPVLLQPTGVELWLDPQITDPKCFLPLYLPNAGEEFMLESVSTWVNDVHHDDPKCLAPADRPATTGSLFDEF